jgi:membrane-associated protease RseP (regulator of RpoE activity)
LEEEHKKIDFNYGVVMLRTTRGIHLIDRLGRIRITRAFSWVLLYIMPIAAGIALYLILNTVALIFSPQGAAFVQYVRSITPLANVLLPGINPYLPIVYGWVALVVALVVHEVSHGVVARSLNLRIKSVGLLLFLIIPIGAFVEIDEKQLKEAKPKDSGRVMAAGSGINLVVAAASLILLLVVTGAMVPKIDGAYVTSMIKDQPAYRAGVRPGDYVVKINNSPVDDLRAVRSNYMPGQAVNLTIIRNGTIRSFTNVTLAACQTRDPTTNKNITYACLGIAAQFTYADLQQRVATYANPARGFYAYLCIPTLPRCASLIPFSDVNLGFYASPYGAALPVLTSLFFWIFFVNFFLSIINSLPIYPLDGGQAFEVAVRALGRGRISEATARRITLGTTFVILSIYLTAAFGPYLSL